MLGRRLLFIVVEKDIPDSVPITRCVLCPQDVFDPTLTLESCLKR